MSWNVVITLQGSGYAGARELLGHYGRVQETGFYNVLLLEVDEVGEFLERLRRDAASIAEVGERLARVLPVERTFRFETAEELEAKAKETLLEWAPRLAGKRFYLRMHRRGRKGQVSSHETEKRLAEALLEALEERGEPGEIDFDDAEVVVDLETVGGEAGLACWTREELERHPFLRID